MAGGEIGTIHGKIVADDEYSPVVKKAAQETEKAKKAIEGMTPAIKTLAGGLGLAAGASLKLSVEFNAAMANVATIIPNNIARIEELKNAVQDMAVATGKSTDDLADGLYQVVSTFGDTADTIKILDITARAATAGMATTTEAINLAAAVTKGYGDTSAEAVKHSQDLAFQTANLGITNFPQLAASIGGVIPLASALGVKQEELFAGFATLSGVTGSTAEVSTQLTSALTGMIKPSDEMTAAMTKLGVSSAKTLIEQKGMTGAIQALAGTTDGSQEALSKLFGRVEALTPVLALTGAQAESMAKNIAEMNKVAGAAEGAFKQQTDGVNAAGFAYKQFRQIVITSMQDIGDAILNGLPEPLAVAALGLVEIGEKAVAYSGQIAQVTMAVNQFRTAQLAANAAVAAGNAEAAAAAGASGGWKKLIGILGGGAGGAGAASAGTATVIGGFAAAGIAAIAYASHLNDHVRLALKNSQQPFAVLIAQLTEATSLWRREEEARANAPKHSKDITLAYKSEAMAAAEAARNTGDLSSVLAATQKEVNSLTDAQKKNIDAGIKLGMNATEIAEAVNAIAGGAKVGVKAVEMYTNRVQEAGKVSKDTSEDIKKMADSLLGLDKIKGAKDIADIVWNIGSAMKIDPAQAQQTIDSLEQAIDTVKRLGLEATGTTQAQVDGWQYTADALKKVAERFKEAEEVSRTMGDTAAKGVDKVAKRIEEFSTVSDDLQEQIKALSDELSDKKFAAGMSDGMKEVVAKSRELTNRLDELAAAVRNETNPELLRLRINLLELTKTKVTQELMEMVMKTNEFKGAIAAINLMFPQFSKYLKGIGEDESVKKQTKDTHDWTESLGALSQAFADLAEASGQTADGMLKRFADIIGLMNVASQSMKGLTDQFQKFDAKGNKLEGQFDFGSLQGGEGFGAMVSGYAQLAQAAMGAASAMNTATNVAGRGNRIMRGAATGLAIGTNPFLMAITAGNSAWIGPLVGAVIGALRNPGFEREMKRVGAEWGIWISEDLAKEIDKTAKAVGDRATAEILSFSKLAQAAGGFNTRNIDMFSGKLRDLFSFMERGQIVAEDAAQIIDENFAKMAETATKKGKLINDSLRDVMLLDAKMGTKSQAIMDFSNQKLASGMGNIAAFLQLAVGAQKALDEVVKARETAAGKIKELDDEAKQLQGKEGGPGVGDQERLSQIAKERMEAQKALDEINASAKSATDIIAATTIKTQEGATAMAGAISGSVALMRQQGMSLVEALAAAQPAIEAMREQLKTTGFDGGEAFAKIDAQLALLADKTAGPVLEGMMSLGDGITDLYNGGLLTVDMFKGMADQIAFTRESLIAQGKSAEEINAVMAPQLQNIWEIQQKWGVELDATTQKMLDEALAAGQVGEKFKSAGERTADALDKVVNRLDLLLEAMGVKLPDAIDNAADRFDGLGDAASGAADKISKIPKKVNTEVVLNYPEGPPPWWTGGERWVPPNPTGETWEGPGFEHGTEGYRNFGSGTLAMLHGTEKVVPYGHEPNGNTTFVLEMDGQPWLRYTSERLGGYVRVRAGSAVHMP